MQQHREYCMARTDDAAAELEHRPIRDDDAGLRQRIKPEGAPDPKRDLAQPKRQRRPNIAAKHEFMTDGQE